MVRHALVAGMLVLAAARAGVAASEGMERVGPGIFRPIYAPVPGPTSINVSAFELDRVPATNAEFLKFVLDHPRWRRDRVPRLFADDGYLAHWVSPVELGPGALPDQPVTRVSWFAAKAYCAAQGKRLATETEWEFAAAAGERTAEGATETGFRERILTWYSRPMPSEFSAVGRTLPNYWGIRDLHGLVWEWVLDYNGTLGSNDSRSGSSADRLQFCGAGAFTAGDKQDYATFMRLAFRSSLEARYTERALGFRCAQDLRAASP
jgi:formylglycine-generating enzyme